ncbi:MAG: hypothetical protein ACREQB_07920, partial [Candidatus Binataceae bacterium]
AKTRRGERIVAGADGRGDRMIERVKSLARVLAIAAMLIAAAAQAASTGRLKLDVMGDIGAGARNQARVIGSDGREVATVAPGATVEVAPGRYKLELTVVGGTIRKDDVAVEAGRTATVMIANVAVLEVDAKLKDGPDPGFTVTVSGSKPPHDRIITFLTGSKMLFAASEVDVKVDAPPQGYSWDDVRLEPGHRARLSLKEVVPAELTVQPYLSKRPLKTPTRVVVYRAGTQSKVMESGPLTGEHHFELDAGDYDVYVENGSGRGRAYATETGVKLAPGARVERNVPLD